MLPLQMMPAFRDILLCKFVSLFGQKEMLKGFLSMSAITMKVQTYYYAVGSII